MIVGPTDEKLKLVGAAGEGVVPLLCTARRAAGPEVRQAAGGSIKVL